MTLGCLDPPSLHDDIHPAPISCTLAPTSAPQKGGGKGGKNKATATFTKPVSVAEPSLDEIELSNERWARYRVGGLIGLMWLFQNLQRLGKSLPEELVTLVRTPALWSSLSSLPEDDGTPSFGSQFPAVRRAAYNTLGALLQTYPDEVNHILPILARELLEKCWSEKDAAVWEATGPTIIKVLKARPELWSIAVETEEADDKEEQEDEDEHESENESEGEVEAAGNTETATPVKNSVAFDRLLDFISTVCPNLPHLTYPILLVVLSTLPATLLPVSTLTPRLETLFAHLWSAADSRLLSTHSLPGQPSALLLFLREAADSTSFLIGKSLKEGGTDVVSWLVKEQLGEKIWKDGVLELGGRSGGRRAVRGASAELEASIFGQALARLVGTSTELSETLLDTVVASTLEASAPGTQGKKLLSFLPRVLPIIAAVKESNSNDLVISKLDSIIAQLAANCHTALLSSETPLPEASTFAETLRDILNSHAQLVDQETKTSVVQLLESSPERLVSFISPSLFVSLVDAVAATSEESHQIMSALWSHLVRSEGVDRDTRFALAKSLLAAKTTLVSPDVLAYVAEEAAQAALETGDISITELASACVVNTILPSEDRNTILALISTAIHDAVHGKLTDRPEVPSPTAAIDIFGSYAQGHIGEIVASDILSRALVGIYHLVVLFPRLHEEGYVLAESAKATWEAALASDGDVRKALTAKIADDLAALIQDVSCRIE